MLSTSRNSREKRCADALAYLLGWVARERAHTTIVFVGHNSCIFALFWLQNGATESYECE
eukprot:57112-Eustigmatos_ZCMA.PRE.1